MNEQVLETTNEVLEGTVEALPEEKTGGVTFGKVVLVAAGIAAGVALGKLAFKGVKKLAKKVGKKAEAQPEQETEAEVVEE